MQMLRFSDFKGLVALFSLPVHLTGHSWASSSHRPAGMTRLVSSTVWKHIMTQYLHSEGHIAIHISRSVRTA